MKIITVKVLTLSLGAMLLPILNSCNDENDVVVEVKPSKLELLKEELESTNHLKTAHLKQMNPIMVRKGNMAMQSYVTDFTPSERQRYNALEQECNIKMARYDEMTVKCEALISQITSLEPGFKDPYKKSK